MVNRKNRDLAYLSIVLFLAFFLTVFTLILNLGHTRWEFLSSYVRYPLTEALIDFNFLFLLGLLFVLYRRWRRERSARKSSEGTLLSLQKAVETMQIGVTITDRKGKIIYINPADAEMHGYRVEELMGKDARMFAPPEIWKAKSPQPMLTRFRRETLNTRKDGSTFPVQLMSDVVTDSEDEVFAVITTCEDISERKKNEETINQLAFYDPLTGLPNRSLFNDRLNQELAKARRHEELLALMFLDIDRFKVVNDTLGHAVGDLLLREVAQRLKGIIREGDTVSRFGGDEFVMIFPDTTGAEDISVIAEKILRNLSDVYMLNGTDVHITVSIGISVFPDDGNEQELLVRNADTTMYFAKEQGRNNYQFYSATINENALERLILQSHLRKANNNEFIVHYQPQVDLRSGRISGAEALVRWQHPEYGLLSPVKFIPLAEEIGLISSIGKHVCFTACAQNKAWQEAGFSPFCMAINISMYQFNQKDFIKMLKGVLDEVGLAPEYVELELTESIVMQNPEQTASTLNELKALGIHCAIDDFGTGYSSLSYLKNLPIGKLKLDKSFVNSLTKNPNDDAISRAVISMAHSLNLRVVAEGVETAEQLDFLRAHQCDEAQGYFFGKPLPAREFVQLLITGGEQHLGIPFPIEQ
ncbi:MAG TPA: EAL domain-containing protein [Thermodesulfovibrionales bacterium]|nr:EAL domain-containing protein [Thermodesulfovibrionales bacterium]